MGNNLLVHRLLLTAPPNNGKTFTLRKIIQHFRMGGVLIDPLNELREAAGIRWNVFNVPRLPDKGNPMRSEIMRAIESLPRGAALIIDEASRFLPSADLRNPIFQFLDIARNKGVVFALAEKRPTRLPVLVTDLADVLAFRPWRSPAARRWLSEAGADGEFPELPIGFWNILPIGGNVKTVSMNNLVKSFGNELTEEDLTDTIQE